MKKFSLKLQLFIFLFLFLAFLAISEKNLLFFVKTMIALVSSIALESLLYFWRTRKFRITESSLVTGLIVGFVLSSDTNWWLFCLAAVIAILSKQLVRLKSRHVFNPAGFGIFVILILFKAFTQWEGAYTWYIIIPAGLYFTVKVRKLSIVVAYYITSLLILGLQSYFSNSPLPDLMYFTNYFFIFIMLIEPKTSPFARVEKIIYGIVVSVVSFILYTTKFPFDVEIPALLAGNLIYQLYDQKRRRNR